MDNKDIYITLPQDNMTTSSYNYIDTSSISGYTGYAADTITISNTSYYSPIISSGTITFENSWDNWWKVDNRTPFIDKFPDWGDFENMRKEYPGLNNAYENLKTVYKMCESDWEGKKREQNDTQ